MTRFRDGAAIELTWHQDLELMCGQPIAGEWPTAEEPEFDPDLSNFASEEERREAWFAHRERLIDWSHGQPWAAERYD